MAKQANLNIQEVVSQGQLIEVVYLDKKFPFLMYINVKIPENITYHAESLPSKR